MLIRQATHLDGAVFDLRFEQGHITAMAAQLPALPEERCIDAAGGLLLPGLHDHHLHLQALAAARASVSCGPPHIQTRKALQQALATASARLPAGAWLRGIGYHPQVAGELDRDDLDALLPDRPLRIQHRSGRLWLFNSLALQQLTKAGDATPLERIDGRLTGRLYDADAWLRERLPSVRPDLAAVSRELAAYGITGVTDTSHDNDPEALSYFAAEQQRGALLQALRVMGNAKLDDSASPTCKRLCVGEHKFHLHEHALPDFNELCAAIHCSHTAGRAVAFHCVTRTELVFALQALRETGSNGGDRIEHASITPPELLQDLRTLGVTVVTQPNFVAERGDAYLRDVESQEQPNLYRLRSFVQAGIALAAGSDAPYGNPNPWAAMQAAVQRCTQAGQSLGGDEALTAQQALALYLTPLQQPGGRPRQLRVGEPADLCLLAHGWAQLKPDFSRARVRMTCIGGEIVSGGWQGE